ncbi:hypothetical protein KC19_11G032500 [Ceratodon purpureus]|uniref:Uncharacterized protein n=1 Tax=Ceratodon purpureus TaxID=3225 RepID=A0A8T0GAT4_CERPU|nr:hypothetical protein KC19_11G032500 [Ceratodon purpureus]
MLHVGAHCSLLICCSFRDLCSSCVDGAPESAGWYQYSGVINLTELHLPISQLHHP